jgi:Methyltransferase domain
MDTRAFQRTLISGWFKPAQGGWLRARVESSRDAAIALVGIYRGLNASYVLDPCRRNRVQLFAIDVWEQIGPTCDGEHLSWVAWRLFRRDLKRARRFFESWVRKAGLAELVTIIQGSSTAAAGRFADGTLDLVFLDADHSYEAMRADLEAWFDKVKRGKLLAGHDWDRGRWPGVVSAVEEFAAARGLPIQVEHELWSLEKT